jgi:hypothetical protein
MASNTKRIKLEQRVTFRDKTYEPGSSVEVPSDYPEAAATAPTPARVFSKPTSSPPNTGGVDTGEGRVPVEVEATAPAEEE